MEIKIALKRLANFLDLTHDEMQEIMQGIMQGKYNDAQIAAFLLSMRMKSETIEEIAGAASVMRNLATEVKLSNLNNVVDIVGTGGDGASLFNVSSAASFVVAAAGGKVAKHGNRAVSSKSGSADFLEANGIYLHTSASQVANCIEHVGIGFMFAQDYHKAMRFVAPARAALGLRTMFNILGPLTNPAKVKHQVIGVFNEELCLPLAKVMAKLGSKHVLVVHSHDGLDEFSLATTTKIAELNNDEISQYELRPEDVGITSQTLLGLEVQNTTQSLNLVRKALGKNPTDNAKKATDMIALNAGAALYAADITNNIKQGVQMAYDAIYSGLAREKINELAAFTQVFNQTEHNSNA